MKLLLSLSFVGDHYNGYQVQKNGPTIQGELNRACDEIFGFPCDVIGCSRTDSGVHANMFCVSVSQKGFNFLICSISLDKIPFAFNAHLPSDIAVWDAKWVNDSFHPRYDVVKKEYVYIIYNNPQRSPFEEKRSWHVPVPLQIEKMKQATAHFIGIHSFESFMSSGSKIKNAERNIYSCEIDREADKVIIKVSANGFLYNMVRIMVGTLVEVGLGKRTPNNILHVINAKDRKLAGITAPAYGLYLNNVVYRDDNKVIKITENNIV